MVDDHELVGDDTSIGFGFCAVSRLVRRHPRLSVLSGPRSLMGRLSGLLVNNTGGILSAYGIHVLVGSFGICGHLFFLWGRLASP